MSIGHARDSHYQRKKKEKYLQQLFYTQTFTILKFHFYWITELCDLPRLVTILFVYLFFSTTFVCSKEKCSICLSKSLICPKKKSILITCLRTQLWSRYWSTKKKCGFINKLNRKPRKGMESGKKQWLKRKSMCPFLFIFFFLVQVSILFVDMTRDAKDTRRYALLYFPSLSFLGRQVHSFEILIR